MIRRHRVSCLLLGALLALVGWTQPVQAGPSVWQPMAEEIAGIIDEAEAAYRAGQAKEARRAVVQAYFGVFESKKMEAALRKRIGAKHAYMVERHFGDLRKAIKAGKPVPEIQALADQVRAAVRRDAKVLDEAGVPAEVYQVDR